MRKKQIDKIQKTVKSELSKTSSDLVKSKAKEIVKYKVDLSKKVSDIAKPKAPASQTVNVTQRKPVNLAEITNRLPKAEFKPTNNVKSLVNEKIKSAVKNYVRTQINEVKTQTVTYAKVQVSNVKNRALDKLKNSEQKIKSSVNSAKRLAVHKKRRIQTKVKQYLHFSNYIKKPKIRKAIRKKIRMRNKKRLHNIKQITGKATKAFGKSVAMVGYFAKAVQSDSAAFDVISLTGSTAKGIAKASNRGIKKIRTAAAKKEAAKKRLKKARKRTLKTAKKAAKKTAKAAKGASKAAKSAKKAAEELKSLLSEILPPIVKNVLLIVGAVGIGIVLLLTLISGAADASVSSVTAVVEPISWLFDNNSPDGSTLTDEEVFNAYKEYVDNALSQTKDYVLSSVNSHSLGSRDTLVYNGSSFYPASSALDYITQSILSTTIDYPNFIQICFIYKQRLERERLGLDENNDPEITIGQDDFYSFMKEHYFNLEISEIGGQPCPSRDCCTGTSYDDCMKDKVDDDGKPKSCPGHTYYYCNYSHKKITVSFSPDSNLLDNLNFTDYERDKLEIGVELVEDIINGNAETATE